MVGKIQSFPFSADSGAKVLILGSMPGVESLRQQQYYAHPRNLFWNFMGELFGAGRDLTYEERLAALRKDRVALWDVAHTCRREGSLDSNMTDVEANDFPALFKTAPHIHTVFFNGQKAAALFHKLVFPSLFPVAEVPDLGKRRGHGPRPTELKLVTLPSTSPANASIPLAKKKAAWKQVPAALAR
ncbi:MAG: DNA-deoxyinosine glycosylase [Kiritimatiellales bacterium]